MAMSVKNEKVYCNNRIENGATLLEHQRNVEILEEARVEPIAVMVLSCLVLSWLIRLSDR